MDTDPDVMTLGEVAAVFAVDPDTVGRWALNGRLARVPGTRPMAFRRPDVTAHFALTGGVIVPVVTPMQAATQLGVSRVTVTRSARSWQIAAIRTPGGHFRILASEIDKRTAGES